MDMPENISFTDFSIPTNQLFRKTSIGPMNPKWVRTQFSIPDGYAAPNAVISWLNDNCPGQWATCNYMNPKTHNGEYVMVVRFEDKNDALMFKLRGGHQSYENT